MDLYRLFYPQSIAVVGASPNVLDGKLPFFQLLQDTGYKGAVHPVNPSHKELDGARVYPSLEAVPGPIDLAIVAVPARAVLATLEAAVKRQVKFVHFFTSGFSETGNAELEKAMIAAIRGSGTRIVGPNCIGVYCTESRMTFNVTHPPFDTLKTPGKVAFLGQSGGVSQNFVSMAQSRGIELNKAVSYGNQIDLRAEDYIRYFGEDDNVAAVAGYIEDVKDGRAFADALRRAGARKPVILLKGGVTDQGARAAASHTGAMAGHSRIFSAIVRQCGCLQVDTFEQLLDTVMLATSPRIPQGPKVGFLGAGGGTSVLFTDLAALHGLFLPELKEATRRSIGEQIADVNTSVANPVDLGAFGLDLRIMANAMKAMAQDDIDVLIPYISADFAGNLPPRLIERVPLKIIEAARDLEKPVIPVVSKFSDNDIRVEHIRITFYTMFRDAGLPVYHTIQDAVYAIRAVLPWAAGRKEALEGR